MATGEGVSIGQLGGRGLTLGIGSFPLTGVYNGYYFAKMWKLPELIRNLSPLRCVVRTDVSRMSVTVKVRRPSRGGRQSSVTNPAENSPAGPRFRKRPGARVAMGNMERGGGRLTGRQLRLRTGHGQ